MNRMENSSIHAHAVTPRKSIDLLRGVWLPIFAICVHAASGLTTALANLNPPVDAVCDCSGSVTPSSVCPGETTEAFAGCYCPMLGGSTSYSLLDNEEGCAIVRLHDGMATVRAGRRPGNGLVIVKGVADSLDGPVTILMPLYIRGLDYGQDYVKDGGPYGGGCCGDGDSPGDGFAFCGGVRVRFNLGLLPDGIPAGHVTLLSEFGSAGIGSRSMLAFGAFDEGVVQVRDDTGMRQLAAPGMLADLVDHTSGPAYGYEIRFYGEGDFTEGEGDLYELVGDPDPFITWVIENPDAPNAGDHLTITKYLGSSTEGTKQISFEYAYTEIEENENWTWELVTKNGSNTVLRSETVEWLKTNTTEWTKTYTATDGSNEVRAVTEIWYGTSGPERIVSRAESPGESLDALDTAYQYWSSGGDEEGLLGLITRPDGSWTMYRRGDWDSDGTLEFTEIEPWGDTSPPANLSSPPAQNASGVKATTTAYSAANDATAGRPFSVVVYADGSVLSETTYSYDVDGDLLEVTEDRNGLETVSVLDRAHHDRPMSVVRPDGRLDKYEYDDNGDFNGSTTNPAFDPNTENGFTLACVSHGTGSDPESPTYVNGKSTKETVVRNAAGRIVLEETYARISDAWVRVAWTVHECDARGRRTNRYTSNGTRSQVDYSDAACCGTRTMTDEAGTVTEIVADALGRVTSRTRRGVSGGTPPLDEDLTTTSDYYFEVDELTEDVVRVEETEIVDSGMANTFRRFDLSGRLIGEQDAAGLVTHYGYSDSGEPVEVTETGPTGEDRVTQHLRDGRVASITGTAVVNQHYGYEVEGAGSYSIKVATGTSINSPRFVKTFYDGLGRVTSEVRPAHVSGTVTTEHTYNATTGQLTSTSTTGMADTLYEYDELGNLLRTALDVDDDGEIDLAGPDRVHESETEFVSLSSQYWRETVSRLYAEESGSAATDVSKSRTRLTGFLYSGSGNVTAVRQVEDARASVTTVTTTTDRTDKTVTVETDHPDSSNHSQTVTLNGLLQSSTDAGGVTTTFGYDALGRRVTATDGRGNVTTTHYDGAGRVDWVKDDEQNQTAYVFYTSGANAGRLYSVSNPAGKKTYYDYTPRGEIAHVWGEVSQPVRYEYDEAYGERTALHTYRGDADWDATVWPLDDETTLGDVTQWTFEESTGLLTTKTYPDASEVDYSYNSANRLYQRTWARGVVTTYSYDSATGELTQVAYTNDPTSTPTVTYEYNRAGRLACVSDAAGERDFVYDPDTLELTWEKLPDDFFGVRDVVRGYGGPVGRHVALGLDTNADGTIDSEYSAGYSYDSTTGRMSRVTGPGLLSGSGSAGVFYSYLASSNLVEKTEHRNSGGTAVARTTRSFEPSRDLIASTQNDWLIGGTTTISKYTYYNDARSRRDGVVREGSAFSGSGDASPEHFDDWSYNDRNELTGQTRYNQPTSQPTTGPSAGQTYGYDYDPIGNRTRYDFYQGEEPSGQESAVAYDADALNQYDRVRFAEGLATGQRLFYDADGNLTHAKLMADMNCDGSVNAFDIQVFLDALDEETGCNAHPEHFCDCEAADMSGDGSVNAFDIQPFVDTMAGLGGEPAVPAVRFVWDAENRLCEVRPLGETPASGAVKWVYTYDYLSRRVAKQSFEWDGAEWGPLTDTRFVHDGWNVIEELDGDADHDGTLDYTPVRKHTWGLDLAGQNGQQSPDRQGGVPQSAGGIGGLLATRDVATGDDYAYLYDASGNVGQMADVGETGSTPTIVAAYEYDPYGGTIAQSGSYVNANPFRFSTKHFDAETGFYDFGRRYYSSRLGRWLNRDPIDERGGENLYLYVCNRPIDLSDPRGEMWYVSAPSWPPPRNPPAPRPPWIDKWPFSNPPWWRHDLTPLDLASILHCASGVAWGASAGECKCFCVGGVLFEIWETQPGGWGQYENDINSLSDAAVNCICCMLSLML